MQGTDFILEGMEDKDIELAKDFFLKFSDEIELETTKYGVVLDKKKSNARIYIIPKTDVVSRRV